MQTEILTDEQYKDLSKNLIKAVESRCRILPLNSLKKSKYTLNRPIYITIEKDEDTIIATLDDIEAFAYADNEFEAINGLCDEIVELYEEGKSGELGNLAPEMAGIPERGNNHPCIKFAVS